MSLEPRHPKEKGGHPGGRRYGRRIGRDVSIAINLAPMIDVTFLLLIFFLVTTTFERAEGILASEMPDQGQGVRVGLPLEPIVVRLASGENGNVTIRVDHVEQQPASEDELVGLLRSLHEQPGFDTDTPVVLVADDEVLWDYVVDTWNAALRAGCRKIAFAEP